MLQEWTDRRMNMPEEDQWFLGGQISTILSQIGAQI